MGSDVQDNEATAGKRSGALYPMSDCQGDETFLVRVKHKLRIFGTRTLMVLILVLSTMMLLKHLILQFLCAYSTSGQFVKKSGARRPPQSQLHVSCAHRMCISWTAVVPVEQQL